MEIQSTFKLAVYRNVRYDFTTAREVTDYTEDDAEYVRISDIVEVNFDIASGEDIVKAQVAAIDKRIEAVNAEAAVRVKQLAEMKQSLLAIPNMEEESDES